MNTNIEELYKQKYLKYKAKYLNIQRGGRFTQGRNHPNHIAFNDIDILPKSINVGGQAGFMALDDKGNIAVATVNMVKIINLKDGTVVETYTASSTVRGIAFDSNNFYIGCDDHIDYHLYNAKKNKKGTFKVSKSCIMLACYDNCVYILSKEKIFVYPQPNFKEKSFKPNFKEKSFNPIFEIIFPTDQNFMAASMAFDRKGCIVMADTANNRIQVIKRKIKIDASIKQETLVSTDFRYIGSKGIGPGQFNNPTDFAFNVQDQIIVADTGNNRVQILDYDGTPKSYYIIDKPAGIVVDGNGRILVSTRNTIDVPVLLDKATTKKPSNFILFPAPQQYFIITSNIENYLDYLKNYDPNIKVDLKSTFVSSYAIISRISDEHKKSLMAYLNSKFKEYTIEIESKTQNILISSTKIDLKIDVNNLFDDFHFMKITGAGLKSETIYKYTVTTTAKDALRFRLTQGLNLTKDDAKKQQTYKTMLDENKLDQLNVEPPLPSK
jgi:hypothetical protein